MKKRVSILLAVILLAAMAVSVYSMPLQSSVAMPMQTNPITPFYVAITSIKAYISMSGSTATCSAAVSHSGAKANVKLILQQSTNSGASYSDFSTLSNKDYTTKSITVEASKSGLTTGSKYKYRTKVVVTVYDAGGKQIDSGTAFS